MPGPAGVGRQAGSAKIRKGSKWLRTALIESARAAARSKGTYLSERYRQVCRRRGDRKAIVAVVHEILIAAWRVLSSGQPYENPGPSLARAATLASRKQRLRHAP